MKIEIELFGASRDFSDQNTLKLEVNEKSNILIIGCEGDTDKNLYNKLYKIGNQKLKKK